MVAKRGFFHGRVDQKRYRSVPDHVVIEPAGKNPLGDDFLPGIASPLKYARAGFLQFVRRELHRIGRIVRRIVKPRVSGVGGKASPTAVELNHAVGIGVHALYNRSSAQHLRIVHRFSQVIPRCILKDTLLQQCLILFHIGKNRLAGNVVTE